MGKDMMIAVNGCTPQFGICDKCGKLRAKISTLKSDRVIAGFTGPPENRPVILSYFLLLPSPLRLPREPLAHGHQPGYTRFGRPPTRLDTHTAAQMGQLAGACITNTIRSAPAPNRPRMTRPPPLPDRFPL